MASSDSIDEQDPNLKTEEKKQKSRRPASEDPFYDEEGDKTWESG
jgi:hypothetical protein